MRERVLVLGSSLSMALVACGGGASAIDRASKLNEEQLSASAYCDLVQDGGLGVRAKVRAVHADVMGELRRAGVTDAGDNIACPRP